MTRREAEHRVARRRASPRCRATSRSARDECLPSAVYSAPRKNSSSATPLTSVMTTTSGRLPWLANSSTRVMSSATASISRAISPPTTNSAAEQQSDRGAGEHRPLVAARASGCCPGAADPRRYADPGPHRGQREREPVEAGVPGPAGQRKPSSTAPMTSHRDDRRLRRRDHRRRSPDTAGDLGDHRRSRRVTAIMPARTFAPARSAVQPGTQHARNGLGHGRQQPRAGCATRRQHRGGQAPDPQRIAAGPVRVGVGQVMRIGQLVDGPRTPADSDARRRPRSRSDRRPGRAPGRATRSEAVIGNSSDAIRSAARPSGTGSRNPPSRVSTARSTPAPQPGPPGAGHPRVGVAAARGRSSLSGPVMS